MGSSKTERLAEKQAREDLLRAIGPVDSEWLNFYGSWLKFAVASLVDYRRCLATSSWFEVAEARQVLRKFLGDVSLDENLRPLEPLNRPEDDGGKESA